jgi:flagellar protein FlaG
MVSNTVQSGGYVPPAPKAGPVDLRPFTPPPELTRQAPREEPDPTSARDQENPASNPNSLRQEIESLNKLMEGLGNRLEFGLFDNTNRLFVKVVDRARNQVVKMLPAEEFLRLKSKIADAVGLIIDEEL